MSREFEIGDVFRSSGLTGSRAALLNNSDLIEKGGFCISETHWMIKIRGNIEFEAESFEREPRPTIFS